MNISVFDIFKIGIGPSSSHTFGPMKASYDFAKTLNDLNLLDKVDSLKIELYGSLALTKEGHGTGIAIKLGLSGYLPERLNPKYIDNIIKHIEDDKCIILFKKHNVKFLESDFVLYVDRELKRHPNSMIFKAFNDKNEIIFQDTYYSIGGGFIEKESELSNGQNLKKDNNISVKYEFSTWAELQKICEETKKEIWEIALENEKSFTKASEINRKFGLVFRIMMQNVKNGLYSKGCYLKGGLKLPRRANILYEKLSKSTYVDQMEQLFMWGVAVAEENASYSRIVTAPTNGAAGVIPAVLSYYRKFYLNPNFFGVKKFLLTAGVVGMLCKKNASISGAECGCQAEIGSACAMAAAGLVAAFGGNYLQCENAAIMGLQHNLGLTCDPVHGLVQIPCIERNGINAVKAVTSAKIALLEEKSNYLTLDDVIFSMKEIGDAMPCEYRETALGGLAKQAKTCNRCDCKICKNN